MRTAKVVITDSALRLVKSFGGNPPALAAGSHREGVVRVANNKLREAHASLKEKLSVLEGAVEVSLTKDEMAALFYGVAIHSTDSYNTVVTINQHNFPVIAELVKAGFAFPNERAYYS